MKSSRECTVALAVAMACTLAALPAHAADEARDPFPAAHSCVVGRDGHARLLRPEALAPRARAALADTNHLSVLFDSPDDPWTPTEVTRLQNAAAKILPALERVYGPPSGSDLVQVIKDPTLPEYGLAGTYSPWDHSIRLYQVDVVTLCHELAHAFHGGDVVYPDGFEEGMAVAATALAVPQIEGFPHPDHVGGTDDVEYELLNQPAISPYRGNFWAGLPGVNLRYDLAGYVWRKTSLEHPGFLREFNRRYYERLAAYDGLRDSLGALIGLASEVAPTVEGQPFAAWAGRQYVLGTVPALGVQIYHYPLSSAVSVIYRHADGGEEPLSNQTVVWKATDSDQLSAGQGTVTTDFTGVASLNLAIRMFAMGDLQVEARTITPYGSQSSTLERPVHFGEGLFGLVRGAREGSVTITPLDTALASETVPVQWGQFEAPRWKALAGRFELAYTDPQGRRVTRQVTKDANSYLALIDALPGAMASPSASLTARPSIALAGCRLSLDHALPYPAHVTIYSVQGKIVRVLSIPQGVLAVDWDGIGADGLFASAGVYLARLDAPGFEAHTRVVVTH